MSRSSKSVLVLGLLGFLAATLACGGGQATRQAPQLDVGGKVRLAEAYVKGGRLGEALETLEQAIAEEPGNAGLHNFYGQVAFLAGRYEKSEPALRRAIELDPYLTDAHNNLGALYDKLGRKEDAEREYRKALEDPAYPTPEKVHLNLGLLYASQGRTPETIDHFRQAVEINPKYYQAHYELASVLDRSGKLDEAAREYEVAAPAYRTSGEFHYRLGFAYLRLGQPEKARQHLNRVLELAPGSRTAVRADELLKMME